ncbi:MAG: AbrB family transcriptional regulator [Armatimonadota bacterium]|nr:AbrB family transcriptional regulator [Armatimonadota bacterium]
MTDAGAFVLLIATGAAGAYLGLRLRLPAGALLGALIAVLFLHTVMPVLPSVNPVVRRWVQVLVGTALGSRVSRETLGRLRQAIPVAVLVVAATVIGTLTGSAVVGWILHVDRGTALLASTPGGMPEMVLMADALDRDVPTVVLIQLIRNILTLIVLLPVARLLTPRAAEELT